MEVLNNSIPSQRMNKKISIEQFELPKLRHKSIYFTKEKEKQQSLRQKNYIMKSSGQNSKQKGYIIKRQINSLHKPRTSKHYKSLTKVEEVLLKYKQQYNFTSNKNQKLLDLTFFKLKDQNVLLEKKKKLQKKKVFNMEKTEQLSSGESSFVGKQNHLGFANKHMIMNVMDFSLKKQKKNQDLYTGPMIVLDYKIEMSFLNHVCFDGEFPLARVGASLSFHNQQIFLFGGCPDSCQGNMLLLHKYFQQQSCWKHVKSTGQKPYLSLIYHSSNSYKDYFIFTGGICIQKFQIKKLNNPHINIFNTLTSSWLQFNWGYYLKHHSSCMINNVLIIHGGINQRQRTQNQIHFVHLNFTQNFLSFSRVVTFHSTEYLSHHRMITTLCEDSRLRSKFKIDGILMFGGKKHMQEKLTNQLYYLEANSFRLNDDDTSVVKKWQIAEIKGPKPQARMCHSFDLLINKGLCVLIGGINQKNQYLNDMWIFDLFGLTWTKVQQVPLLRQTGGIAYHATVVNQSQIYLYGGLTKNQTNKQFYLIQTQKFKRQYSKHHSRKRVQASSNMISFKAFQ